MASLGDEALDGYMFPACAAYPYPHLYPPAARGKGLGGGWRPRGGDCPPAPPALSAAAPSAFPGCGQLAAAEHFDSYQRAQLMALLSQVGAGPRPRRAGSRDAAVQVNPRRDASVQCALGRRTLPRRPRAPAPPAGPAPPGPERGSPPGGPRLVRFPRTVALYSPVASRRLATFLGAAEAAAGEQPPGGERAPPPPSPRGPERADGSARRAPPGPQTPEEETAEAEAPAAVRASREQPAAGPGLPSREARGDEAAPRSATRSPEPPPRARGAQDAEGERAAPRSPEPGRARPRFQVRPGARGSAGARGAGGRLCVFPRPL